MLALLAINNIIMMILLADTHLVVGSPNGESMNTRGLVSPTPFVNLGGGGNMEKVMVFIDGAAMYFGLLDNLQADDIDYQKFVDFLVTEDRKLVRAYYYNSIVDQGVDPKRYSGQMKFYGALNNIPYFKTKYGRLLIRDVKLRCRRCGERFVVSQAECPKCKEPHSCTSEIQKGVDVKIATDILVHAFKDHYDTAILVTGDGDLAEAVEQVSQEGKHVENAFFQKGSSPFLRDKSDVFTELTITDMKPLMGYTPGSRR